MSTTSRAIAETTASAHDRRRIAVAALVSPRTVDGAYRGDSPPPPRELAPIDRPGIRSLTADPNAGGAGRGCSGAARIASGGMRLKRLWVALGASVALLRRELPLLARRRPRAHGTAQGSLSKPWRRNADGRRTILQAVELAKRWGIVVEDDVRIVASDGADGYLDSLGAEVDAAYAGFTSQRSYTWDDLLIQGRIVVKLRSAVLDSDEGILDVLGHEMHEINALRSMFEQRGRIPGAELIALAEVGRPGNLHDQAWDAGARVVRSFRGGDQ